MHPAPGASRARAALARTVRRLAWAILPVAAVLTAACGNSGHDKLAAKVRHYRVSDVPAPPAQQVLRRRLYASPSTLDPTLVADQAAYNVIQDLFEGLVTYGPDGAIVPGVARSWDISDDGRTYVFHLRSHARWSNGAPVTAADFVYAWRREVDPKSAAVFADALSPIVHARAVVDGTMPASALGVTAVDAHTLKVQLVRRTPYFLSMLYATYFKPLYAPAIRRWGEAWTRPGHLVGNGPFRLTEWVINGHLTLKKNPYYWNAAHVRLREVIDYPIPKASSAVSRYLSGGLDLVDNPAIPTPDLDWLRGAIGDQVKVVPYYGTGMLGMQLHRKPFDDPRLRRALTLVLDRKVIVRIMHGTVQPAHGLFPPLPGFTRHPPAWSLWPMQRRIAEARRLYRAAGYSEAHPLRVKLLYPTRGVSQRNLMQAMATLWHQTLGAQITPWNEEWKVFLQDTRLKNARLYWNGWIGEYPAPYTFAALYLKQNPFNYGGYDSPGYQQAVARAQDEPDRARRYADYDRAAAILDRDVPFIAMYHYKATELVKPYVAGYRPNALAFHLSQFLWIRRHAPAQAEPARPGSR